jgi:hypothetical protein
MLGRLEIGLISILLGSTGTDRCKRVRDSLQGLSLIFMEAKVILAAGFLLTVGLDIPLVRL